MKPLHALLALTLACSLFACTGRADRSNDTASFATGLDTAKARLARAQLVAACRDTVARANPKVRWVADTALAADLNYDGAPELVVWGTEGDTVFVVAIVGCSGILPGRVWTFPLNALKGFGTTKLDVALEAAGSRSARDLSIGVDDRDHVQVYWDPDAGGFVSRRP